MNHCETVKTPQYATVEHTFRIEPDSDRNPNLIIEQRWVSGVEVTTNTILVHVDAFLDFHRAYLTASRLMGDGPLPEPAAVTRPTADDRYAEIRKVHPNAYKPWSDEENDRLRAFFGEGHTVDQLSKAFGRQDGSIRSRLAKLGLT